MNKEQLLKVLNLVINGLPSILLLYSSHESKYKFIVLNLVINGLPSILKNLMNSRKVNKCFKPCYKWITFNTWFQLYFWLSAYFVLNLVINGLPSIQ